MNQLYKSWKLRLRFCIFTASKLAYSCFFLSSTIWILLLSDEDQASSLGFKAMSSIKTEQFRCRKREKSVEKEEVLPMIANGSVGSFLSVTPCNCFVFLPMRLDESFFVLLFGIILCFLLAFYFESWEWTNFNHDNLEKLINYSKC